MKSHQFHLPKPSNRIIVLFGGEIMGIVNNDEVTIGELGLMMAGERRGVE